MAGKGGGAWKVAYADFVTAMMAFFMVMWITAQSKPLKEAVAHYFNDPFGTSTRPSGSGSSSFMSPRGRMGRQGLNLERRREVAGPRNGDETAGGGDLASSDGGLSTDASLYVLHGGQIERSGTVLLFDEGAADLRDGDLRQLRALAPSLLGKRNKIEIRGHASRKPLPPGGPYQDGWQLSYARCLATLRQLEAMGVEPERIRLSQAAGYEPFSLHVDPESLARNSRVEVYVLGEFVDDLQGTREERAERLQQEE
jgi:chemotaxis protein MotB